jgi:single-strand DNA-binding protein
MSTRFIGSGNLGAAPVTRTVEVDGESRSVTDMRVYFDRRVPQDDGSFTEEGGFWLTVTTWGRLAESCARVLRKGMRVRVEGRPREHGWDSEDGPRTELRLTADRLALELAQLDAVTVRAREQTA